MDFHLVQALLQRLYFAGPLLYVGLVMAVDPVGFVGIFRALTEAVRDLDLNLRSGRLDLRRQQWLATARNPVAGDVANAIRLTGAVLSAAAFLILAGLF